MKARCIDIAMLRHQRGALRGQYLICGMAVLKAGLHSAFTA